LGSTSFNISISSPTLANTVLRSSFKACSLLLAGLNPFIFSAISFPLFKGKEWDGLVYIRKDTTISIPGGTIDMYKDWNSFSILSLDVPETIAGISYDSVLTIKRVDKINNIERRYSFEKYAKNIGLISRQDSILDTQCGGNIASCINTPWSQKAEKGFILDMQLIESNR
jgi:hypothetical protein